MSNNAFDFPDFDDDVSPPDDLQQDDGASTAQSGLPPEDAAVPNDGMDVIDVILAMDALVTDYTDAIGMLATVSATPGAIPRDPTTLRALACAAERIAFPPAALTPALRAAIAKASRGELNDMSTRATKALTIELAALISARRSLACFELLGEPLQPAWRDLPTRLLARQVNAVAHVRLRVIPTVG